MTKEHNWQTGLIQTGEESYAPLSELLHDFSFEQAEKLTEIATLPEWPTDAIEIAEAEIARAAHEIRFYYHRQLSILRAIPYLALEADGRGGWSDEYGRAYHECMLAIHNEMGREYDLFIELRTGALLSVDVSAKRTVITRNAVFDFGGEAYNFRIATDRDVYEKLANLDESKRFNPAQFAMYLMQELHNPYHNDDEYVQAALKRKQETKFDLDRLMAKLPEEEVRVMLREQGFDL